MFTSLVRSSNKAKQERAGGPGLGYHTQERTDPEIGKPRNTGENTHGGRPRIQDSVYLGLSESAWSKMGEGVIPEVRIQAEGLGRDLGH